MMTNLSFLMAYSRMYFFALLAILGVYWGDGWTFLGIGGIFVLHPILDNLIQKRMSSMPINPPRQISLAIIVFTLPFLTLMAFYGLQFSQKASSLELWGLIISFGGIFGALGITTAHELVHRKEKGVRALGIGILLLVNFAHWEVEHVFGHHKNVATDRDPASARKNEWIYPYLLRSFWGGFAHSFLIEHRRLQKKSLWAPLKNRVLWLSLLQYLVTWAVYEIYGLQAFLYWLGQSLVAIFLLQTIDYIEHYGLRRQKLENGDYESVKTIHSWDCYQTWTNGSLLNLGFHSHHHMKASLPYENLQKQDESLRMPLGYSAMALLALVPPLYFKIMNPRLLNGHKK